VPCSQIDPLKQAASELASDIMQQWRQANPQSSSSLDSLKPSTTKDYKFYFSQFLYFLLTRRKTFEKCALEDIFQFLSAYASERKTRHLVSSAVSAIRWYF
jgi:hypothetical protein